MRILMLSDFESSGGAGIAASRLAQGLADRHDVLRCVLYPDGKPHPWQTVTLGSNHWLGRQFFRAARRFLNPAIYRPVCLRIVLRRLRNAIEQFRPDVINVHNLHGGWDRGFGIEMVDLCASRAPTTWTLHDMWSFTGRCAYAYDCRRFEEGCSAACPTPREYPVLRPSRIGSAWQAKRDLFAKHPNLTAISPSRWLAAEAKQGLWRRHEVAVIPNGLPLDIYKPAPRTDARRALGLPLEGPLALIVAQSLAERRKGAGLMSELWQRVRTRPLAIASMGNGASPETGAGIRVHPLGFIGDPRRQALVYSAADLLVHPAPVDNLPNVVVEAIACGTPVVGFPIGGMPDMVKPGVSGWLARRFDPAELAAAVDAAFTQIQSGKSLRESCRTLAEAEFGMATQANRYEDLFRRLACGEWMAA